MGGIGCPRSRDVGAKARRYPGPRWRRSLLGPLPKSRLLRHPQASAPDTSTVALFWVNHRDAGPMSSHRMIRRIIMEPTNLADLYGLPLIDWADIERRLERG